MERILVVSDVHGNHEALKTVINNEDYDKIWVLGDLVDYGPDPDLVIDLVKEEADLVIRGNHDNAAAYNVDCRCGPKTRALSYYTRKEITLRKLGENDLKYLGSLKEKIILEEHGIGLFHGSPANPLFGYLYPWYDTKNVCHNLMGRLVDNESRCETPFRRILIGHTHYQFSYRIGNTLIINPGSTGQPRDGDWRASYTMIYHDGKVSGIHHKRIKYDVNKVITELRTLIHEDKYYEQIRKLLLTGTL